MGYYKNPTKKSLAIDTMKVLLRKDKDAQTHIHKDFQNLHLSVFRMTQKEAFRKKKKKVYFDWMSHKKVTNNNRRFKI